MSPIHKVQSSLRYALTRTILVWAGLFFVLLTIVFMLTFDDVRNYTLQKAAEYRLQYQAQTFAKHLQEHNTQDIIEESNDLVLDPQIAAIVLVNAKGELLNSVIHDRNAAARLRGHPDASGMLDTLAATPHLHLYHANIPHSGFKLYLVLDDRPITRAIRTSTVVTVALLLALLLLSIYALHRVLRNQLVEPLEQLRSFVESGDTMPGKVIEQLEESLPSEAGEILATYDQLVHTEHEMVGRFHDMLNQVPGCVWSASADMKYTDASSRAGEIFGCQSQELPGQSIWAWLPDEKQQRHNLRRLRKAIADGTTVLDMAYSIRIDGSERWFGENIALAYTYDETSGKKRLKSLFGISNDITRRKAEESEIENIQQRAHKMEAIATLVGGIAHEFNNMLAGIIGNVFLLKTEFKPRSKAAQRLARIEKLGNRATGLVDQLLAFGRRNRVTIRNVALLPLLKQVQAIETAGLPAHVKLNLDVGNKADELTVLADPTQLKQLLGSLISNAIDACADMSDAEISIGLQDIKTDTGPGKRFPQLADKNMLCLYVRDNGSGILPELQDRIFEPFFTTKQVGKGAGMGLPMAYGLMQSLGGAMELKSAPGVGTTVYLYLQQVILQDADKAVEEPSAPRLHYGRGQTVLVADDEALLRIAAQEMLVALRYRPVVVQDGQAALNYVQERGDDLTIALLDLVMPGMSGSETAAQIRLLYPQLPIVFITGFNLSETDNDSLQLPLSRIVTKPYRIEHLSQMMDELLQEAKKEQHLHELA